MKLWMDGKCAHHHRSERAAHKCLGKLERNPATASWVMFVRVSKSDPQEGPYRWCVDISCLLDIDQIRPPA